MRAPNAPRAAKASDERAPQTLAGRAARDRGALSVDRRLLPCADALIAKISVSQSVLARPPYRPIFEFSDSLADIWAKAQTFTLDSYRALVSDTLYLESYLSSLTIAAVSTLITLIIAYPFALAMARAPERLRPTSHRPCRGPVLDELSHPRLRLDRAFEG